MFDSQQRDRLLQSGDERDHAKRMPHLQPHYDHQNLGIWLLARNIITRDEEKDRRKNRRVQPSIFASEQFLDLSTSRLFF